jgi:hypothetical protein
VFNENVYYVPDLGRVGISFDLGMGIYKGNNSGCGALMLAVALGCTKIGLLGYDFKVQEDGKTHCHSGYRDTTINKFQGRLDNFRGCMEEIGPLISELNVLVYNLNPDSALQCFEKITWDEFQKLS